MKNPRGGRLRYWPSLRCRMRASARRSPESGRASGQTAAVRSYAASGSWQRWCSRRKGWRDGRSAG